MNLTSLRLGINLLLIFSGAAYAQDFHGSLLCAIDDASGARVSSAKIVVDGVGSASHRQSVSNQKGEFRFNDLQPGNYHVSVTAAGLQPAEANVTVAVSSVQQISVTLLPSTLTQTVTVQGSASSISTEPLDTTTAVNGGVVAARDLQSIPLASRSFANISFLVPGTEPVEPSDPTKARITAVSFGGSSGLNDVLSVDGGDNSDDYIGGFLQSFSPDGIQEFAVQTSQQDAATGRTVGGSVIITTKRGTNELHGIGAFYERAAALDARYPIENPAPLPKQPFSRQNYVADLGGSIVKDKLWFSSSYEGVHERASIAYSPASLTQFQALASLASQGLIPGVSSIQVPNNVPIPFRDNLASQRLDWAQSPHSQWFLRGSADSYVTDNAFVQQATLPSTGTPGILTTSMPYLETSLSSAPLVRRALPSMPVISTSPRRETPRLALLLLSRSARHHRPSPVLKLSERVQSGNSDYSFSYPAQSGEISSSLRPDRPTGTHSFRWGVDVIHEPVLSGALSANAENLTVFAMNPVDYLSNPAQFAVDLNCTPSASLAVTPGTTCSITWLATGRSPRTCSASLLMARIRGEPPSP